MNSYIIKSINNIIQNVIKHNDWDTWYNQLIPFRKNITKYIYEYQDKNFYKQHRENYHILGYYAPLIFKILGFNKEIRTPVEQIFFLAQKFKQKNIDFIYVPIPCKLSIYPELYMHKKDIPEDGIVVPQWQKMILDLLLMGVEVIDLLPYFLTIKNDNPMLYTESFFWSPTAAHFAAKLLAQYLHTYKNKTNEYKFYQKTIKQKYRYDWFTKDQSWLLNNTYLDDKLYEPYNTPNANISVFGDCNIYEAMPISSNVTAQLAYMLQRPIQQIGRHTPFTPQCIDTAHSIRSILPSSLLYTKCIIYLGFISDCYVKPSQIQTPMWNLLTLNDNVFQNMNLDQCNQIKYKIDTLLNNQPNNVFTIPDIPTTDIYDYTNDRIQLLLIEYIKYTNLFDEEYYTYAVSDLSMPPIDHYVKYGAFTTNPNAWFNTALYLKQCPDIYESKMNPLYHFLNFGIYKDISPRIYNPESLLSLFKERLHI